MFKMILLITEIVKYSPDLCEMCTGLNSYKYFQICFKLHYKRNFTRILVKFQNIRIHEKFFHAIEYFFASSCIIHFYCAEAYVVRVTIGNNFETRFDTIR